MYDGKQVYASPRALAACMTRINIIDLTRRSPSYENRLPKYADRGLEVYWPDLDRSKIDPTIFERSFGRTEGLARLLVLEKLPKSSDRDAYLDQRRAERGRPPVHRRRMRKGLIYGNTKIGATRALNHVSASGSRWYLCVSWPLLTAIRARDSFTALKLLSIGAKSRVEFSEDMKASQTVLDHPTISKQNQRDYEMSLEQPVVSAVSCEMPLLAKAMIEQYDVDPKTLTLEGYRVLHEANWGSHTKGQSLLDMVKKRLKHLRKWKPQDWERKPPKPLKDDSANLSEYQKCPHAL